MSFFSRKPFPAPEGFDPPVDDQGRLACDLFCHHCHYNLRGLPRQLEACPECGAGPELSIDNYRRMWFSEKWLKHRLRSYVLILVYLLLLFLTFFDFMMSEILSRASNQWLVMALLCLSFILFVCQYLSGGVKLWWSNKPAPNQFWTTALNLLFFVLTVALLFPMLAAIFWPEFGFNSVFTGPIVTVMTFTGVWVLTFRVVYQQMALLKRLRCQPLPYWLYIAAVPVFLLIIGLVELLTRVIGDSILKDGKIGIIVFVLATISLISFHYVAWAVLTDRLHMVVAQAIYTRQQARLDDSAPAGVVLPPPAYGWLQHWIAKRFIRRLSNLSKKSISP